jgi:hypothetical protein
MAEVNKVIYVGVEVFGLIVTDVHLFPSKVAAKEWFKKYTGVPYPENDAEWESAELGPFEQTKIFEKSQRVRSGDELDGRVPNL